VTEKLCYKPEGSIPDSVTGFNSGLKGLFSQIHTGIMSGVHLAIIGDENKLPAVKQDLT
jgi:hypothetical protein